jgi:hypothetical protein
MSAVLLELEPGGQSLRGRTWMMLIGCMNLAQAFYQQNVLRYVDIAFGVLLIAGGFYFWKLYKPKIVTFDDTGIEGKIGLQTNIGIEWSKVSKLEVSLYSISILTNTGEKHVIDASNITFQQHQEIKPKILELAKSKGVEVIAR